MSRPGAIRRGPATRPSTWVYLRVGHVGHGAPVAALAPEAPPGVLQATLPAPSWCPVSAAVRLRSAGLGVMHENRARPRDDVAEVAER